MKMLVCNRFFANPNSTYILCNYVHTLLFIFITDSKPVDSSEYIIFPLHCHRCHDSYIRLFCRNITRHWTSFWFIILTFFKLHHPFHCYLIMKKMFGFFRSVTSAQLLSRLFKPTKPTPNNQSSTTASIPVMWDDTNIITLSDCMSKTRITLCSWKLLMSSLSGSCSRRLNREPKKT